MSSLSQEYVEVLLKQEKTSYRRVDYMGHSSPLPKLIPLSSDSLCSSCSSSTSRVSERWRERICEWSYQVVDHFDLNREIVSVSLSYLDRFLSTRRVNQKIFQLAAMTSLYLAIKLYEPGTFKIASLIKLSRGYFKAEHIVAMEKTILRDLSWHMHPPTPQSFARHFNDLLPDQTKDEIKRKQDITDLSNFLMELSVCDYFFVTRRTSSIALAAILSAIEILQLTTPPESVLPCQKEKFNFRNSVCNTFANDNFFSDAEVLDCEMRLRSIYESALHSQHSEEEDAEHNRQHRGETISPVCVSGIGSAVNADDREQELEQSRKISKTSSRMSPSQTKKRTAGDSCTTHSAHVSATGGHGV